MGEKEWKRRKEEREGQGGRGREDGRESERWMKEERMSGICKIL